MTNSAEAASVASNYAGGVLRRHDSIINFARISRSTLWTLRKLSRARWKSWVHRAGRLSTRQL